MASVLVSLQALQALDPKFHWFCNGVDAPKNGPQQVSEVPPSVQTPRQIVSECYELLAYNNAGIQEQKDFLVSGINRQLGKCDVCIVEYYKSKRDFLDKLREEYNDEDVETLSNIYHDYDIDRICRGLDQCIQTLQTLPPEKRNGSELKPTALHAVLEALSNEKFLLDRRLVQTKLTEALELVQTNDPLLVAHYVPAIPEFLVSKNKQLQEWSERCLGGFEGTISQEAFEFAFRGPLHRHLAEASNYPVDIAFVSNLWRGLKMIVNKLDNSLITHSLRAQDVNVYKLALDHLQMDTSGVRYIIQTLRSLIEKSPKDFWDAMGAIGPTTVAEQVFRSPQFVQMLYNAQRWEFGDTSTAAADMLAWMKPLIASLQIGQRPPICRTILSQLMSKLQNDNLPSDTKLECYKQGLHCLIYTLQTCDQELNTTETISSAIVVDALGVTRDHFGEIVDKIGLGNSETKQNVLEEVSALAVERALMLECKALQISRNLLQNSPKGAPLYTPVLWTEALNRLRRGNLLLSRAMIAAMVCAADIEHVKASHVGSEMDAFNSILDQQISLFGRSLDTISMFSLSDLKSLAMDRKVVQSVVSVTVSAENTIHESAVNLTKSMTEGDFRRDALQRLLETSLAGTLEGISSAALRIVKSTSFGPCSAFLRICSDMLKALSDPQDGVLRRYSFSAEQDVHAVKAFWDSTWRCLKMMYDCSESYSRSKVAPLEVLREFVRDVMDLSQELFSQFAVFNNAVGSKSSSEGELPHGVSIKNGDRTSTKELLQSPAGAVDGVVKFLRLKDEYLLRTSVQLVGMLLSTLTKESLVLHHTTSEFLARVVIYNDSKDSPHRIGNRTLLTGPQLAEIQVALDGNLGRPYVQEIRAEALQDSKALMQDGDADGTSTTHSSSLGPTNSQKQRKRQGTIDFGKWGSQMPNPKSVERQKVKDSSQAKPPSAPALLGPKGPIKQMQFQKTNAQREDFLNERKKQKEEAEKRRAEQVAKLKRNISSSIAGQTSGEGSALAKIGVVGKDHAPKGESMMVSSDSESASEDEFDQELFGTTQKNRITPAVAEFNATRAKQMRAHGPVKKPKVIRSAKHMRARLAPVMTGLWRRMLSWDFFHDGNFPPDSTKDDYDRISDLFNTAADYRRAFEELLLLEAWSSLQKSREEGGFRAFEIKISNRISVDALFEVSVSMDFAQCKSTGLLEADIIVLSKSNQPAEDSSAAHCLGRISRVKHRKGVSEITIQVAQTPNVHSWLTQTSTIHAARIDSIVTLEREYGALVGLEWYDLCQEIIRADVSPILRYVDEKLDKLAKVYKLNKAQAKAVQSAIDNDAFTLIQGPPGSGKSKTIVAIVGALLTETLRDTGAVAFSGPRAPLDAKVDSVAPKKLLVCAPSNAAVDELVMRFMDGVKSTNGTLRKPKVVRLGRSDRVNPQVLDVTLDEQVDKIMNPQGTKAAKETSDFEKAIKMHKDIDKELKEMYVMFDEAASSGTATTPEMSQKFEKLKRDKQTWSNQIERLKDTGNTAARDADMKKRKAERQVVDEAHIICATLSGSARESFQHLTIDFETVIIDEAAQCIELSALIPLKYGCNKCIMVGDPKQLPPTVLSREAARFQYEQSLFVRMQRAHPRDVHLLDTQYRMHPDISRFPSTAFYDGKLLDGPGMSEVRTQPWHEDVLLGPYRFYDVAGRHENAPKGHSLINRSEVEVAVELYKRLKATVGTVDFTGKIGVITPYKSQLRLLTETFTSYFGQEILKVIEFNTTDAFQGRESEIIIFSCVRASAHGIGFLADIRRMNVGITRAKSSLWVLGSSESLTQGEYWRALVEDARARGLCSQGSAMKLLKNTPRIKVHGVTKRPLTNTSRQDTKDEELQPYTGPRDAEVPRKPPSSKQYDRGSPMEGLTSSASSVQRPESREWTNGTTSQQKSLDHPLKPPTDLPDRARGPSQPALTSGVTAQSAVKDERHRPEPKTRENTPTDLKRKRASSPREARNGSIRPPPPPTRKLKSDDAAFIKPPRRKGR